MSVVVLRCIGCYCVSPSSFLKTSPIHQYGKFFHVVVFIQVVFPRPSTVFVFDPSTPQVTAQIVNSAFAVNGGDNANGQWLGYFVLFCTSFTFQNRSDARYAFLFKPGAHAVDVSVGYYTSVIGLGKSPTDTRIQNVNCPNGFVSMASDVRVCP